MLKKLLFTTALSGLMLSSAMAQSTPDATRSGSNTAGASMSSSASTISQQAPDQLLASKLHGADVYGANNEKIGDISDLLFSKDGQLQAYLVSVGGFLGVGAKEVALTPDQLQMTRDKDTWKVTISMTKDQLAQAPNFERHKEPTTTGSATSSPGAMKPANTPATPSAPSTPPRQ